MTTPGTLEYEMANAASQPPGVQTICIEKTRNLGPSTQLNQGRREKIGVTIVTPIREFRGTEDLPPQIGRALRELAGREDAKGYQWEFMAACGGLCSAQNRAVHEFLQSDHKWLLRWDRDLHEQRGRDADAILRLLSHKQPVVGGLYCKRQTRPTWVASFMPKAKMQPNNLAQCAELGGGFKLYHRKFFEEIRRIFGTEPFEEVPKPGQRPRPSIMYRERETGDLVAGFHQIVVDSGDLLSEDYYLDYLARCAGVGIFADTLVRMKHIEPDGTSYPEGAWPPIPTEDTP